MITAKNETTKRTQEVVATAEGALRVDPTGIGSQDIGLIIDAASAAAGATVYSPWYDGIQWVRTVIYASQSTRTYNMGFYRRDTDLVDIGQNAIGGDQTANSPNWRTTFGTGATGVIGYSCRFYLKNQDLVNTADLKLRVQLLG